MSTDAQRKASAKYLAAMVTKTVRVMPAEDRQIRQAAADAGESVQGYILGAVRARMAAEKSCPPASEKKE